MALTDNTSLLNFISKRIYATNGMAITAEVWDESHEFHRRLHQMHCQFFHQPGIISGLEVLPSKDPAGRADTYVTVQPGMAIDALGQVIVLTEPQPYNFGNKHGPLRLLMIYTEGPPTADVHRADLNISHVHHHFRLQAMKDVPTEPFIELARVNRVLDSNLPKPESTEIRQAADPLNPQNNEIDSRFRMQVAALPVSVCALHLGGVRGVTGGVNQEQPGLRTLAQAINRSGRMRVNVDSHLELTKDLPETALNHYTLVSLVASDVFTIDDEIASLHQYLRAGGTLLAESDPTSPNRADAHARLRELFKSFGMALQPLARPHLLLQAPHLFAAAPEGFGPEAAPDVQVSTTSGVMLSNAGYGWAWQGQRKSGPPSREVIRAAHEFGENILAYALARQGYPVGVEH